MYKAFLLFIIGCGNSTCPEYVDKWCDKGIGCGFVTEIQRDVCEEKASELVHTKHITDGQCKDLDKEFASMDCVHFLIFLVQNGYKP